MSIRPFYLPGEGAAPAIVEISAQVIGTSADTLVVATGALSLTTQGNRQWTPAATRLRIASRSEGAAWMDGVVTSYDAVTGALVVAVDATGDALGGTFGDWSITLTGEPGAATNLASIPTTIAGTDATLATHAAGVAAAIGSKIATLAEQTGATAPAKVTTVEGVHTIVSDAIAAGLADALGDVGHIYTTKAAMDADLAPADGSIAQVQGDPDTLKDGIYRKSGGTGTGSWVYVSELPSAAISRVSGRADALVDTLIGQVIGVASPVNGSAGASASTYVLRQEAWRDGFVETAFLWAEVAGGLTFGVFDRVGNVFTRVSSKSVRVAAGMQTVYLGLAIEAGQYAGFTTAGGVVSYVAATGEGYFAGTLASEAFTDSLASTSLSIQCGFYLRAVEAPADQRLDFSSEDASFGVSSPAAGTNVAAGTLVLSTPTPDGVVGSIRIYANASATIDIGLYKRVGITPTRLEILRRTTVAPGMVNTTRIDRAVDAGFYIGFQTATTGWTQYISEANPGYWYTTATTGDSFDDEFLTTTTNIQVSVEVTALKPAPTHRIGLADTERVLIIGPSYAAGHYNPVKKNWASKVALWSRHVVENFGFSGETIATLLDRIRTNTVSSYSTVAPRAMNAKYVVICEGYNSETSGAYGVSFADYLEDLRQMAQTVKGMGAVPIICTEWKTVYDAAAHAAIKAVAEETGSMFIDLVPHTLRNVAGTMYSGFWRPTNAAQHFGIRSNHIVADQVARVLGRLPPPRNAIRMSRKRSGFAVGTIDDLAFRDAFERGKAWQPLALNQVGMSDDKYMDELVPGAAFYTTATVQKSEHLEMQAGASVAFGDYALVESTIDATASNVHRFSLILSETAATVYVLDTFVSPYPADGEPVSRWVEVTGADGVYTLDKTALGGRMQGDTITFLVYKAGGLTLYAPRVEWMGFPGKPLFALDAPRPAEGDALLPVTAFSTISGARATGWESVGGTLMPSADATYQLPFGVTHFVTVSDTLKAVQRLAYVPSQTEDDEVEIVVTARNFPPLVDSTQPYPGSSELTAESFDYRRVTVELIDQAGAVVMPHVGRVGLWWDEVRFRAILPMRTGPVDLRVSADGAVQVAKVEARRVRSRESILAGPALPAPTWHKSIVATPSLLTFYIAAGGSDVVASDDHGRTEAKAFATFDAALTHALNTVRFTGRLARVTFAFGPGSWGQLAIGSNLEQGQERDQFVIHITSSNVGDWARFHSITNGSWTDVHVFVEDVRVYYMSIARGRMVGKNINLVAKPVGADDFISAFRSVQNSELYLFGDTTVEEAVTYTQAMLGCQQEAMISLENGDVPAFPAWNLITPGNITAPVKYRMVIGSGIYCPVDRYSQLTFASGYHVDASSWSTQTLTAVDLASNTGAGGPVVYSPSGNTNSAGYRKTADAYFEAWGTITRTDDIPVGSTSLLATITLPEAASSAGWHLYLSCNNTDVTLRSAASGKTTTTCGIQSKNDSASAASATIQWRAFGRCAN